MKKRYILYTCSVMFFSTSFINKGSSQNPTREDEIPVKERIASVRDSIEEKRHRINIGDAQKVYIYEQIDSLQRLVDTSLKITPLNHK